MTRLIDAYKVKCDRDDFDTYADYIKAYDAINEAPTVDAVPVIRCKDCKWHQGKDCMAWDDGTVAVANEVEDDGYCYLAERKDNEV